MECKKLNTIYISSWINLFQVFLVVLFFPVLHSVMFPTKKTTFNYIKNNYEQTFSNVNDFNGIIFGFDITYFNCSSK